MPVHPEFESTYIELLSQPFKKIISYYQEWLDNVDEDVMKAFKGEKRADSHEIHAIFIESAKKLEKYNGIVKEIKKNKKKPSELVLERDQLLIEHFFLRAIGRKLQHQVEIDKRLSKK